MKSATKHLTFNLPQRRGLVQITDEVAGHVAASGIACYYECDGRRPKRLVLKAIGE